MTEGLPPLNWNARNPAREASIHRTSEALIRAVLNATKGQAEIEVSLALGAACPYGDKRDRALWAAEIARIRAEE